MALQDAQSEGLLDRVDYIETVDTRDRAENIAVFADLGYDIIVTVGPGISEQTVRAAEEYANVRFIAVQAGEISRPPPANYVALVFPEERSGFLAGAAAALVSRTKHVAAICEADFIDWVHRYCEGFRAGVAHADAAVRAQVIYRPGSEELLFRDTAWGEDAALGAVAQGADVVFAAGAGTADAALKAAARSGVLVIGAETDPYVRLPEIRSELLTSAVLEIRSVVLLLLQEAAGGQFAAGEFSGQVGLAPFHELDGRIAPEVVGRLQQIEAELEAGTLQVDAAH